MDQFLLIYLKNFETVWQLIFGIKMYYDKRYLNQNTKNSDSRD